MRKSALGIILLLTIMVISAAVALPLPSYGATNFGALNERSSRYDNILVQEVVNADTLILENGEIINVIGVRAFGNPKKRKRLQRDANGFVIQEEPELDIPIEERSVQYVRDLLEGKRVRLEFDAEQKDGQYRTLAYVFLIKDNTFVNADILRHGFGDLHIQPPNFKYAAQLREAYRDASAYRSGMNE